MSIIANSTLARRGIQALLRFGPSADCRSVCSRGQVCSWRAGDPRSPTNGAGHHRRSRKEATFQYDCSCAGFRRCGGKGTACQSFIFASCRGTRSRRYSPEFGALSRRMDSIRRSSTCGPRGRALSTCYCVLILYPPSYVSSVVSKHPYAGKYSESCRRTWKSTGSGAQSGRATPATGVGASASQRPGQLLERRSRPFAPVRCSLVYRATRLSERYYSTCKIILHADWHSEDG
jgi:hypothetical protein